MVNWLNEEIVVMEFSIQIKSKVKKDNFDLRQPKPQPTHPYPYFSVKRNQQIQVQLQNTWILVEQGVRCHNNIVLTS